MLGSYSRARALVRMPRSILLKDGKERVELNAKMRDDPLAGLPEVSMTLEYAFSIHGLVLGLPQP